MTERASVIIVSRNRPDELRHNLPAFRFQTHRNFELILVADPTGIAVAHDLGLAERIKLVPFDEPNISAARNMGLLQATAPLVAFIDDDATPEPPWLSRLLAPFADPEVSASTGFIRGRNGISYQWRAIATDHTGEDHLIRVSEAKPSLHPIEPERIIKTQGTNCAFRRAALAQIGGFDPGFRFFLDETDVNHRLAPIGGLTAVVPRAQVHHGFAENALRKPNRVPIDLAPIGRSTALFLRKHCPEEERAAAFEALRSRQHARLMNHKKKNRLSLPQIESLMTGLESGIKEGLSAPLHDPSPLPEAPTPFLPFVTAPGPQQHKIISTTLLGYRRALVKAREEAKSGTCVVTIIRLSRTIRFHRSWFDSSGFWVQRGGLYGRSEREDALFCLWRRGARTARESKRINRFRSPDP